MSVALLDAVLENCIFYISLMFEFSHSQGHSRRFGFGECPVNARFRTYRLIAAINAKGQKPNIRSTFYDPSSSPQKGRELRR